MVEGRLYSIDFYPENGDGTEIHMTFAVPPNQVRAGVYRIEYVGPPTSDSDTSKGEGNE